MEKILKAFVLFIVLVILIKNLDKIFAIGNAFFNFLYTLFV